MGENRKKSKVIAVILWLILGGLGVHDLYLQRPKYTLIRVILVFIFLFFMSSTKEIHIIIGTLIFIALFVWWIAEFFEIIFKKENQSSDNNIEYCPKCGSEKIKKLKYCRWCGNSFEEGIISGKSHWVSEKQNFEEKSKIKIEMPFGNINQYQYELLETLLFEKNIENFSQIELLEIEHLKQLNYVVNLEHNVIKINNNIYNYILEQKNKNLEIRKKEENKKYMELEPLKIYNKSKPEIISFISDSDYRILLNFYSSHMYGSKTDLNRILREYPYEKYDWNVLLQIIWTNQNFYKNIENFKKAGIKKVKLICLDNCECCKNLNKKIDIPDIKELPIKECDFDCRICQGAIYQAVLSFED